MSTTFTHVVLHDEKVIAVTNSDGTIEDARAFVQIAASAPPSLAEWTPSGRLLRDGLNTGWEIASFPTVGGDQ